MATLIFAASLMAQTGNTHPTLYIVIDKAVRKDGLEIPLQAIIAAAGARFG
jgi:hypothetical protein